MLIDIRDSRIQKVSLVLHQITKNIYRKYIYKIDLEKESDSSKGRELTRPHGRVVGAITFLFGFCLVERGNILSGWIVSDAAESIW